MNLKQFETNIENLKEISPDIYTDTMLLSIPFYMLHKKLFDEGEDVILKESGINQSELDVLAALYYVSDGSNCMTPTQLYDVMLFSSGGMTKLLKKLEKRDFICRVSNDQDKRSKLVKITTLGKKVTSKALKDIVTFEDKYFSRLDTEEQDMFKKLIYKMLEQ
ncbi:MAG: MarR family transcriptional regulator [Campylobacteraceae bacterium]|nr:MarR family transcriptional regulator [Campylobacteraceae bacterium]